MTKRELLAALEPYPDDRYVFVLLHSDVYPQGCQIFIQGVTPVPPQGNRAGSPLAGIVVHNQNKELPEHKTHGPQ